LEIGSANKQVKQVVSALCHSGVLTNAWRWGVEYDSDELGDGNRQRWNGH
jgi:hypothetical protein